MTEVDPICALQAAMDGFEVVTLQDVAARADIFITATGNRDVITLDDMRAMKDMAIVGNIGHFDNEIQVAALRNLKWTNIKDQVDMVTFPDGKRMILLSQGRLLNLGNATGHPSFVMSASFTNQVLAQIELWTKGDQYENKVYVLPKHLDEKVARLHLARIGVRLTELRPEQADYIGVAAERPVQARALPLLISPRAALTSPPEQLPQLNAPFIPPPWNNRLGPLRISRRAGEESQWRRHPKSASGRSSTRNWNGCASTSR